MLEGRADKGFLEKKLEFPFAKRQGVRTPHKT